MTRPFTRIYPVAIWDRRPILGAKSACTQIWKEHIVTLRALFTKFATRKTLTYGLSLTSGLLFILIDPFGLWFQGKPMIPGFGTELMIIRAGVMMLAIISGLGVGWLCSAQGRSTRRVVALMVLAVAVAFALMNNSDYGWISAWIISAIGFIWGMRCLVKHGLHGLRETPNTFGSSRWATMQDVTDHKLFEDSGIRLGAVPHDAGNQIIRYQSDARLLTVAPTRSGKGVTQIIPNLLTYTGSTLVIDPKGENAMITAAARQTMGQAVHVVDPWGIAQIGGITPARFNPLDWLVAGDVDITENAMLLADALILPQGTGDAFWQEEAKALLQGLILYVATDADEAGQRHLGRVRDLLLLDGEDLRTLFGLMTHSAHHIVASTGARCLQKEDKLLSNVIASAQAETHFLDSARIRDSLSASDFRFEDLKGDPMSLYLVLPADRLHPFARWLRLLIQQAITVNARNIKDRPDQPVLFILDEMAALGRLAMIEQAYGLMAGFGLQLWGIVQDFNQLERLYGKGWQSFVANAGMINYFGSSDRTTAEYFSAMCGDTTVWNLSSALSHAMGSSSGKSGSGSSDTITNSDTRAATQRKLAYPDELMRLGKDQQLVFIDTMHPLMAQKQPWFEDDDLKTKGVNLHAA